MIQGEYQNLERKLVEVQRMLTSLLSTIQQPPSVG